MRRWNAWALSGVLVMAGLACDDKPDVPAAVLKAQQNPIPTSKPLPTTQELLTGPKKRLRLPEFPISIEVPTSWQIRSIAGGDIFTIAGQGSSGEFDIQLVQQGQLVDASGPTTMMNAAKKEMAPKPHPINRVEMHQVGPLKVLEVRMISNAFVNGKLPPEVEGELVDPSNPNVPPTHGVLNPHLVRWTFSLFIPAPKDHFAVRGLSFMSLGLREYERDKDFLEQMMKSLKYEE